MKNLVDVYEKLSIDDINLNGEFPVDGTYEEVFDFLKNHNFIPLQPKCSSIVKLFNMERNKCIRFEKNRRILFADTSKEKISERNPVFLINFDNNSLMIYYLSIGNPTHTIKILDGDRTGKVIKDFMEELNKHFGWE